MTTTIEDVPLISHTISIFTGLLLSWSLCLFTHASICLLLSVFSMFSDLEVLLTFHENQNWIKGLFPEDMLSSKIKMLSKLEEIDGFSEQLLILSQHATKSFLQHFWIILIVVISSHFFHFIGKWKFILIVLTLINQ